MDGGGILRAMCNTGEVFVLIDDAFLDVVFNFWLVFTKREKFSLGFSNEVFGN